MEAFALRDLSFAYPGGTGKALDGVNLTVERGSFLVLCGPSGSGKSTLLRQLKPALTPHGVRSGKILFGGRPLTDLSRQDQAARIGFVQQDPENQIVTDKVWHELAFGAESLGMDSAIIRRRTAEMASFFGIQTWYDRDTASLSGGQKQLLNLAAVMILRPEVLILDEPTAQLDPIAASDFLAMVGRIHRELGTTVILTEHRLEEVFPLADTVAVLDRGRVLCTGTPAAVGQTLKAGNHPMFRAMPVPMRVWAAADTDDACPVTVREGRDWLEHFAAGHPLHALPEEPVRAYPPEAVLEAEGVWFRYDRDGSDVVKGLDLSLRRGEVLALLGGNGTGKTTTLKLLSGAQRPIRGTVACRGRAVLLPQNPGALFVRKTVREELAGAPEDLIRLCGLDRLADRNPADLSGGERQRLALARVLSAGADILLLDEPTKGLDGAFKARLGEQLAQLARRGVSILLVSHDVEFCARYAHRCALLFDGQTVTEGTPREFFSGNSFYTTAANRMARTVAPEAVTAEDLIVLCGGREPEPPEKLPEPEPAVPEDQPAPVPERKKIPRRTMASAVLILLLIPLTLYLGETVFHSRRYYLTALLVLAECMLPFFLIFEGRRPQARELALIAALCALGVAGRAAFFMLPECKPVLALTILAGVALGGETGFLVGAVTMLASNVLFSQGPWTPWQMFAMGIIGFLAGLLFRRGGLPRRRGVLCLFGAVTAVVIYGGIMNTASALMWAGELNRGIIGSYLLTGLPMDCVHAGATAGFLWFGTDPVLDRLERIRTKYGLI